MIDCYYTGGLPLTEHLQTDLDEWTSPCLCLGKMDHNLSILWNTIGRRKKIAEERHFGQFRSQFNIPVFVWVQCKKSHKPLKRFRFRGGEKNRWKEVPRYGENPKNPSHQIEYNFTLKEEVERETDVNFEFQILISNQTEKNQIKYLISLIFINFDISFLRQCRFWDFFQYK